MSSNKWLGSVVKNINLDISSNSSNENLSFKAAKESMNNLILKWNLANSTTSFKLNSVESSIDSSIYQNQETKLSNCKPPIKRKIDADYSKYLAPSVTKHSGWKQSKKKWKQSTDRHASNKPKWKLLSSMQTGSHSINRQKKANEFMHQDPR